MDNKDLNPIPNDLIEKLFNTQHERFELPNGLVVLHEEDRTTPLISIQAWVKTGSIHEGDLNGSGLSHYLEHLLFKGTEKRVSGEIAKEVQELGGSINAYTAFDRTVYYIDGPSEGLSAFIDILADMLFNSQISSEDVEKEREVILREIDMGIDDPDRMLIRNLLATAFRTHPYKHPVIGHRENFENVTRDQLFDYYKSRYVPNNIVLSVCGSTPTNELKETITNAFGSQRRKAIKPIFIESELEQIAQRENKDYGDFNICRGCLGFKIPSMRHADSPGLDIIAAILSSGHSGLLRSKLRDELKLVHSISASNWNPGEAGLFLISYQCDPDKAHRAEDEILKFLNDFAEEFNDIDALNKAKRFAVVSEMQSRQTFNGVASRMGLIEAIVGDPAYPKEYFTNLKRIQSEDVKALSRKYFVANKLTTFTLNSESQRPSEKPVKDHKTASSFKTYTLFNGARIIYQRDERLPRVSMRYTGLGGSIYEDTNWRGGTALLATLLTKDTQFNSEKKVAAKLESVGGFMNEVVGNNTFALTMDFISGDEKLALNTFEEALLYPAFKEETIDREKENQMACIRESMDEVLDFGRLALRQNFFATHPFSSDPLGNESSVRNLSPLILTSLYRRLFVASNAVVTVCGDFDPDFLIPRIEAILLQLSDIPLLSSKRDFNGPIQPGSFKETLPREQAVVFDSYPDCGISHRDYLKGEIIDELLSDMSGPLFTNVREEQNLAYFVGATRLLGLNYGMFTLYAGTAPESIEKVQKAFEDEINTIRQGDLSHDHIKRAKTRLKVHKTTSLQTLRSRAGQTALNALYGLPTEDWKDYDQRIDQLTQEDIKLFAIRYLDPAKKVSLTVSPN